MTGGEGTKTVMCDITFRIPMEYPESFSKDIIEFHLNESSWCFDNAIEKILEMCKGEICSCYFASGKLVDN